MQKQSKNWPGVQYPLNVSFWIRHWQCIKNGSVKICIQLKRVHTVFNKQVQTPPEQNIHIPRDAGIRDDQKCWLFNKTSVSTNCTASILYQNCKYNLTSNFLRRQCQTASLFEYHKVYYGGKYHARSLNTCWSYNLFLLYSWGEQWQPGMNPDVLHPGYTFSS